MSSKEFNFLKNARSPRHWFALQLLFAILPLLFAALLTVNRQPVVQTIVYLVVSMAFYTFPLILARNLKVLAAVYTILGFGAWIFLIALYRVELVPVNSLPQIFATSNIRETIEYVSTMRLWPCLILLGVIASIMLLLVRQTPSDSLPASWRKGAFALVLCTIAISLNWDALAELAPSFPSPISDVAGWQSYPAGLICLGRTLVKEWGGKHNIVVPPFNAKRTNVPDEPELHVLVIGESSRWDSWGVNGYSRPTSPILSSMAKDELTNFSRVHAGANWTYLAVPLILSGIPAEHYHPRDTVRNLLGWTKEVGFTTAWLSSQDTSVALNARSPVDFDLENLNTLGEQTYVTQRQPFDEELLPYFRNFINYRGKRKFVILHVSGSHMQYALRYPSTFAKFSSASDGLYANLPPEKARIRDEYDNSILYSDWFLGQVIDFVKRQKGLATVTFMSDHGEDLFEGSGDHLGHGSIDPSEHEQHIPMFMWANSAFRERYADKWHTLQNNRDKPIGQESFFHTIADLLDVTYPDQSLDMSFARPNYAMRSDAMVISNALIKKPGAKTLSNQYGLVPVKVY